MKRPAPAVPVDPALRGRPPGRPDPFAAARAAYWKHAPPPSPGRRAAAPNLFAELVRAEYGPDGAPAGRPAAATAGDLVLAGLRRRVRAGRTPPPETCVRLLDDGDHTRAAVFDAWPEVVRRHGAERAAAAVRRGLLGTRSPHLVATLLDLAAAESLAPLARPELVRLTHAPERTVRHAAWRLLAAYDGSLLPPHAGVTPGARPADAYERLLREALRAPAPPAVPQSAELRPGTLVAQSMLLGHLDRPGEGLSGGLGVLLGALGDALARTDGVAGVLTLVTACVPELEADPVLLRRRGPRHWVLRLPVDSPRQVRPEELGRHREALAWWATRLLGSLGRPVDVLHVRYADDGSLALAEAARRSGAALVFTAAPDPHRQMTERHAAPGTDANALRHDLHRVFVADRLVDRADRVVGIAGAGGGADELLHHFPQLAGRAGGVPDAPPEGIPPYRPPADAGRRIDSLLAAVGTRLGAAAGPGRPRPPAVLLTVGRLHPVKQQDVLVRAWAESGAFRESVLVCVGGSPSDADPAERAMRARVERAVAAFPEAAERLLLLPALANAEVRTLERRLADPANGLRARYVCPSAKEEFGLAVLEAMEAGLLVAAPVRGGVPHYLVDGRNGLLIDTSCARTIGEGLLRLLRVDDGAAAAMARSARDLVRSTYSSNAMARALARHYTAVAPGTPTGRKAAAPPREGPLRRPVAPEGRTRTGGKDTSLRALRP
ncbi:glycosyltransferase [Streptomyces sp. NRRL F-5727]|uniref:glycosyltransferase n=1 Tax=Streptomyces sp. NRRL F-5727 TaxID=1463871 RepID=UPI00068B01EF|nr:glycosyltransferase [Streptomyces sp. NRRL F-5727]